MLLPILLSCSAATVYFASSCSQETSPYTNLQVGGVYDIRNKKDAEYLTAYTKAKCDFFSAGTTFSATNVYSMNDYAFKIIHGTPSSFSDETYGATLAYWELANAVSNAVLDGILSKFHFQLGGSSIVSLIIGIIGSEDDLVIDFTNQSEVYWRVGYSSQNNEGYFSLFDHDNSDTLLFSYKSLYWSNVNIS